MKVSLVPVTFAELKTLIHDAYRGDDDLILKYQQGERNFEECVAYNYNEIVNMLPVIQDDLLLWRIDVDSEGEHRTAGYCVTIEGISPPMLFSFAVKKEFRTQSILTGWLDAVHEQLQGDYYTALWNKNTRAIKFFEKNGFTATPHPEQPFVYLTKGNVVKA